MGYTGVKAVYGKSRRKAHHNRCNERIEHLESMLHTQQEMLGKVLEFLPAEVQQQFGVTPTRPSVFPTQVSSNNLGEQQLPMVDEVTRSFIFL